MKNLLKILMSLILISIPVLGVATTQNFTDATITVMSYNIRLVTVEDNPENNWNNRIELFLQNIREQDPDIIGMQEVTEIQALQLDRQLTEYDSVRQNRDPIPFVSEASPVYFKKDVFTLLDSGTFWLSKTPEQMSISWNSACYRICTYVVLKHNASGKIFTHFNTHLDHRSEKARKNGLDLIISRMKEHNQPAVLTGDFNFNENDPLYKTITQELDDTKYISPDTMSAGSFHGFGRIDITNGSPIDFIMVTPNSFIPHTYKVLVEDYNGRFTSDHYAVLAVLTIR